MTDYIELDLEGFGYKELYDLSILLEHYTNPNKTIENIEYPIKIGFNMNSGNVFIIDYNEDVFMMNGSKLEQFYSCGYCGHEGFKQEYLEQIGCDECKNVFGEIEN